MIENNKTFRFCINNFFFVSNNVDDNKDNILKAIIMLRIKNNLCDNVPEIDVHITIMSAN